MVLRVLRVNGMNEGKEKGTFVDEKAYETGPRGLFD
jgi:hypothetical protein